MPDTDCLQAQERVALAHRVMSFLRGIGLAVTATSVAGAGFIWIRRRSSSLLAPIGLHWAFNAVGALAAALTWRALAG